MDDTHQKRVNTSLDHNPVVEEVDGMIVRYVFTRHKQQKGDGDGNPLIYALKGINSFTIVPMYRTRVMDRAQAIVASIAHELEEHDHVMPLPSSNGLAREVAEMVCAVIGKPLLEPTFLRKKTAAEMVVQYGEELPPKLTPSQSSEYKSQIALWRRAHGIKSVSMKGIDTGIRGFFDPLVLSGELPDIEEQRVLLVDDLMSSGTTLGSASSILTGGKNCQVSGLCLLSGLPRS
ncbi:hypothetical protein NKH60_28385 [Mesorhizobium sp. M1006]|uniref:hypothetical protein n=1 Tax=Mesorhizobium sp. M1006 TaxID=2957048 RepID=UPI003336925D